MGRSGCKPNYNVVLNKTTKECDFFPNTETPLLHAKNRRNTYANLGELTEKEDALLVAECRNHDWDADYLAYMQQFMLVHKNILSGDGEKINLWKMEELLKNVKESQPQPPLYNCIGNCGSLCHAQKCDACFELNSRVWKSCAIITILREYVNAMQDSEK